MWLELPGKLFLRDIGSEWDAASSYRDGGVPLDESNGRHRSSHHTSRRDDRSMPDDYIRQYDHTGSDKNVTFNPDALIQFSEVGDNYRSDADRHAVLDCDQIRARSFKNHILTDKDILPDVHSARTV